MENLKKTFDEPQTGAVCRFNTLALTHTLGEGQLVGVGGGMPPFVSHK